MLTRKILCRSFLILSITAITACGNADTSKSETPEKMTAKAEKSIAKMELPELLDKITTDMNALSTALAKVDNEANAQQAVTQMRRIAPEYKAVTKRLEALEGSNDIKLAMTVMQKGPKLAQAQMALYSQIQRINTDHPELAEVFKEAAEQFDF